MDAKITKLRLSRMLSYDWLKIVGVAAALIFAWVLIFTTTATRVRATQQFTVSNYMGNIALTGAYTDAFHNSIKEDVFTYEVIETSIADLVSADESTGFQLLQARTATNELDLMYVSTQKYPSASYKVTGADGKEETKYYTYAQHFIGGYAGMLHKIPTFLADMEKYLNTYFTEGYANADSLDEKKVEEEFRFRAKKEKDKRYKKEKDIQKGVEGEIARMHKYRDAYVQFNDYLSKGYVSITNTSYINPETGKDFFEGKGEYSINICPSTAPDKMKASLSKYMGYWMEVEDEEGKKNVISAADMQVCLFDSNGKEEAFRYEGLVYVTHFVGSLLA